MMQGLLIDVVVIKPVVALESGLQIPILPRVEPMRIQYVTHAAIETLHHAVGLRPVRRDQAMFDAMPVTEPIHPVPAAGLTLTARGEAIGKGLPVICQQDPDPERCPLTNVLQKGIGILCGLMLANLQVDPARRAVDRHEEIALVVFIGHLGQMLDVDMDIARLIGLEGLMG